MAQVSVIIPVRGQAPELVRCLEALLPQIAGEACTEVIVVDNSESGPDPAFMAQFPQVCWLHEPSKGSYRARNRGIEAAQGDTLAFLDADCIPSTNWIAGVHAIASASGAHGITGGPVEIFVSHDGDPTAADLWELRFAFPVKDYVERESFVVTANAVIPREVFERVGTFDSRLQSGGDFEFCRRAASLGFPVSLDERIPIRHPARSVLGQLIRKRRRVVEGRYRMAEHEGSVPSWQELVRSSPPPLRRLVRLILASNKASLRERMKLGFVELVLHQAGVLERLRLRLGRSDGGHDSMVR